MTQTSPPTHVAICVFGLLPRYHLVGNHTTQGTLGVSTTFKPGKDETTFTPRRLLREYVHPSFIRFVIRANPPSVYFDVFVHNGEPAQNATVREVWQPRTAAFGDEGVDRVVSLPGTNGWAGGATPRMFASIESVLRLKRNAESERGALYDWVFLMRSDVVWQAPFVFGQLNASFMHIARWCHVPRDDSTLSACRPMAIADRVGAPDYYFAGGSLLVDRVFGNLSRDFEAKQFTRTTSSVNHAVVAGRLISLGLWKRVRRHMFHAYDVQLLRWQKSSTTKQSAKNFRHELAATRFVITSPLPVWPATGNCTKLIDADGTPQHPTLQMQRQPASSQTASCPANWLWCMCPASSWPSNLLQR